MGLSQHEFGELVGLNRGNIASYEKQSAEPNIKNLSRISRNLNIDLSDLIEKDLSVRDEIINQIESKGHIEYRNEEEVEEVLRESLEVHQLKVEKFRRRSDEMIRILEGFKQFHKFRMENAEELSLDVKKMAMDYEKLLEVLEDVLNTNRHMLALIEKKGVK